MLKSFVFIMLSATLIFSMLAPALDALLDLRSDSVVLADFSEEEPTKSEKEIYEKDIVLKASVKFEPYCLAEFTIFNGFYKEDSSMFEHKILLPPPKHIS
jgi:hypothetical protein